MLITQNISARKLLPPRPGLLLQKADPGLAIQTTCLPRWGSSGPDWAILRNFRWFCSHSPYKLGGGPSPSDSARSQWRGMRCGMHLHLRSVIVPMWRLWLLKQEAALGSGQILPFTALLSCVTSPCDFIAICSFFKYRFRDALLCWAVMLWY